METENENENEYENVTEIGLFAGKFVSCKQNLFLFFASQRGKINKIIKA